MKIENVELFYLSMPEIIDEADGSQDALIVKVEGGGYTAVSYTHLTLPTILLV